MARKIVAIRKSARLFTYLCDFFRSHSLALVLAVMAWSSPLTAQNSSSAQGQQAVIEIVRLQHRDPAPIRQAITPLLVDGGIINQIDKNLIISTSRANLAQLQEVIAELDTPRRQLRASVDFQYGRTAAPLSPADTGDTTTPPLENSIQSIVMIEGEYAHFSVGSGAPVSGMTLTDISAVLEEQSNPEEQSITFNVVPRGTGAVLEIVSMRAEPGQDGVLETVFLSDSVNIALNQWQVMAAMEPDPAAINELTPASADALAVRVELLP